jgi:hypothetical protein
VPRAVNSNPAQVKSCGQLIWAHDPLTLVTVRQNPSSGGISLSNEAQQSRQRRLLADAMHDYHGLLAQVSSHWMQSLRELFAHPKPQSTV